MERKRKRSHLQQDLQDRLPFIARIPLGKPSPQPNVSAVPSSGARVQTCVTHRGCRSARLLQAAYWLSVLRYSAVLMTYVPWYGAAWSKTVLRSGESSCARSGKCGNTTEVAALRILGWACCSWLRLMKAEGRRPLFLNRLRRAKQMLWNVGMQAAPSTAKCVCLRQQSFLHLEPTYLLELCIFERLLNNIRQLPERVHFQ